MRFQLTKHAIDRAMDRLPDCKGMTWNQTVAWLERQLESAAALVKFKKSSRLCIPGGIAIVRENTVTSILTVDQHQADTFTRRELPGSKNVPKWLADSLKQIEEERG